jgi:uncharacterized protein YjbI with pentapeptide repeats
MDAMADNTLPTSTELTPISRADITSNIQKGSVIEARAIQAEDLVAALIEFIGPDERCDQGRALKIDRSAITGAIKLVSDAEPNKKTPQVPYNWLSIPVEIKSTSIGGPLTLSQLGLSCAVDLSKSAFGENVRIDNAMFGSDLVASDTTFKKGVAAINNNWVGSAIFSRAEMLGIVSFTSNKFEGTVDFENAVFHTAAGFLGSTFDGKTSFREAKFGRAAQFSFCKFEDKQEDEGQPSLIQKPFYMTEFSGESIFRQIQFNHLTFFRTSFRDGADFHMASGHGLYFQSTSMTGQVNVDDTDLDEFGLYSAFESTQVNGEISFRGSSIGTAHFDRAVFIHGVDFQDTVFGLKLDLSQVSFEDYLQLEGASFPIPPTDKDGRQIPTLVFDDVTINKGFYVDADQWLLEPPWWAFWRPSEPRVYAANPDFKDDPEPADVAKQRRFWRELVRAFAFAGNLQLKNDAEYREQRIIEPTLGQPQKTLSLLSRWFWGYGVRPARVFIWFVISLFAFAVVYWTQLGSMDGEKVAKRSWIRAKLAFLFSWRTSWELKFGYEHSATGTFRTVTIVQSILGKILLSCFAYSLTQTSPLLSELLKKLLP